MKRALAVLLPCLACWMAPDASAQTRRDITGGGSFGPGQINITPSKPKTPQKIVKRITYMAASPQRQWTSTDGKTIVAALLSFDPDPKAKQPSSAPILVKDGKIRLLKGTKPFVLPLARLKKEDQDYVRKIEEAAKAKAKAKPPAKKP